MASQAAASPPRAPDISSASDSWSPCVLGFGVITPLDDGRFPVGVHLVEACRPRCPDARLDKVRFRRRGRLSRRLSAWTWCDLGEGPPRSYLGRKGLLSRETPDLE